MCPGNDTGHRLDASLLGLGERHQDRRGGTVVDPGSVTGGDRTLLLEGRTQLCQAFQRGAVADILVVGDNDVTLARLDRDGRDLVFEATFFPCGLGFVLRGNGVLILLIAGNLVLLGDVLCLITHVVAVEGIPEAVLDHGINETGIAHFHAIAQVRTVGGLAHALLAAGNDDAGGAELDLLGAKRDGA
jgi:hypothetical protein